MLKLYPKKKAHLSAYHAILNIALVCYRNYSEKLDGDMNPIHSKMLAAPRKWYKRGGLKMWPFYA